MPSLLTVDSLSKTYTLGNKKVEVLKGITMKIEKGDLISIMGVSGVGKSTFLQILGTLDHPTEGTVWYNDKNIFTQNETEISLFRNKTIGFVYQFHHLLPEFSALDNVKLPMLISGIKNKDAQDKATYYLNEVGLNDRKDHKPGELSGGEQQRVAIARSLIMEPEIVLADEPTGNLDRYTAQEVEDLMLELNEKNNVTFILATHNETLAARLNKKLRLNNGIFEAN